ncbi:Tat pathway signal protein [Sphingomonas gilva]|uniref:Tat pathway signal protein n=1 Tax=Sphingomonas gilva TaxID=2305907 RepID=A0A396S4T8_9SPHN|nr:glucoamylase family protein [Sphingomonas gilva]RHW18445.1 Tat pathway signal protein [Sphingomonas gilva]
MFTRRRMIGRSALGLAGLAAAGCTPVTRPPSASDGVLVEDLQRRTFQFFWDTTDARTGLAPDRWPTRSFASIAAIGFALTAYGVGVSRGWATRAEARSRTRATLEFLAAAPQGPAARGMSGHKGFFYHFLDMEQGRRFDRTELSTIDTALLMGGVLFAQGFFDGGDTDEKRIRALADQLYTAIEWTWIRPRAPFISMGWHPETGFIPHDWDIYNEALLLHILALGSPTHAVEPEYWPAQTARFEPSWGTHWGQQHLHFAPLFGHQYSHMWIDFRGIREPYIASKGMDYFENSRRATLAQKAYADANPKKWTGYGGDIWGLTACDGPGDFTLPIDGVGREFHSYSARGPGERDDGTIAPTAAAGSIAFAAEIVVPAIDAMHARYGRGIWGRYGFWDSFNPTLTEAPEKGLQHGRIVPGIGWVDGDYLGIDQGPIVLGIENWKTGLVWQVMRKNPHIVRGLRRAGFTGGWLDAA